MVITSRQLRFMIMSTYAFKVAAIRALPSRSSTSSTVKTISRRPPSGCGRGRPHTMWLPSPWKRPKCDNLQALGTAISRKRRRSWDVLAGPGVHSLDGSVGAVLRRAQPDPCLNSSQKPCHLFHNALALAVQLEHYHHFAECTALSVLMKLGS